MPTRGDLTKALALMAGLAGHSGPEPFPMSTLAELQDLTGADLAAGYVEQPLAGTLCADNNATRPAPSWLQEALHEVGTQDPIHAVHCHHEVAPVAISDRLPRRDFERLAVYDRVCDPLGVADSLRLYLPSPSGHARFFFFDKSTRTFGERSRAILRLLRPHLTQVRARHEVAAGFIPGILTPRETEIMELVATGLSNADTARALWLTEHTVRKHLENIYARLDVHSRTAALAVLRGSPRPVTDSTPHRRSGR